MTTPEEEYRLGAELGELDERERAARHRWAARQALLDARAERFDDEREKLEAWLKAQHENVEEAGLAFEDRTRALWLTLVAAADKTGLVNTSIPALAFWVGITVDECEASLSKLRADGRIVPVARWER